MNGETANQHNKKCGVYRPSDLDKEFQYGEFGCSSFRKFEDSPRIEKIKRKKPKPK